MTFGIDFAAHPAGLWKLFVIELWERFSYYGMRSLLVLYMVHALQLTVAQAATIYGTYTAGVYLTPIVGGMLADRWLGQWRTVVIGAWMMAAGHFAMAWPDGKLFYFALSLIALGSGLFKPNISVMVGRLYDKGYSNTSREVGFSIFYMGINIGAFAAPLVCGTIGQRIGWHYGFGIAGVGMCVAGILCFWLKKGLLSSPAKEAQVTAAEQSLPTEVIWQRLLALASLALLGNVLFWAAFEQAGTSLTLFADSQTKLALPWLHTTIPSSWFVAANPLYIALLAPSFAWLWQVLARYDKEPTVPIKMSLGLLFLALGFVIMGWGGEVADREGQAHMGYLLGAYLLLTCGELCISPVGLALVTKLAPPHITSLVMGMWFGSLALAHALSGYLASFYQHLPRAIFFAIPATSAAIGALLLLLLASMLHRMMHLTPSPARMAGLGEVANAP